MIRLYLIALVSSFLVSLAVTPLSARLAVRFGAMDPIDPRKVHSVPKPRWGGIGIMTGFFFSLILLWMFVPAFHRLLNFKQGIMQGKLILFTLDLRAQLAGILIGTLVLFIVGLFDDRKPVPALVKLLFQIITSYIAMLYGVRIYGLSLPGFEAFAEFPMWLVQILTIFWLVGLSNAVNLIDGLDGLAAGVVMIIAGAFLGVTLVQGGGHSILFQQQMRLAGIISAALMGGTAGFLLYNFYPARLFMGDSGSLSVGFLVACIAVIGAFKTTILAVLFIPLILVAVPVTDMAMAFGRRILNKQSPFTPDRRHFHHRLLDAGWTQREVVLLTYTLTLALSLISVTMVGFKKP